MPWLELFYLLLLKARSRISGAAQLRAPLLFPGTQERKTWYVELDAESRLVVSANVRDWQSTDLNGGSKLM